MDGGAPISAARSESEQDRRAVARHARALAEYALYERLGRLRELASAS